MWWHEVVWGRPQSPRRDLIGGFAMLVVVALAGLIFTNLLDAGHPLRRAMQSLVLPVVLFYAPGVVAMTAGFLRCGVVTGLLIGAIPGVLFAGMAIIGTVFTMPGVGGGDAPLWSITVAFSAISMMFAIVGFLTGTALWHLHRRLHTS